MDAILKPMLIMLGVGIPITIILMRILFKKSVFAPISTIWVITIIITSINTQARILIDSYTQAFALPIGIIAVVIGIYYAAKYVKDPLKEMIDDLSKLSKGDINIVITGKYNTRNDEIGVLARSINDLSGNFKRMIAEIQENSINIVKTSNELNSITKNLLNYTSSQASSIEEISSTMEEITSNINQNTNNSIKTEELADKTVGVIKESKSSIEDSSHAMKDVAEKIKVINDIAFQTNILALNAAVEASHAGEAGKGFAVVASEVKKLAEKSNAIAKEVEEVSNKVIGLSEKADGNFHEIVKESYIISDLIKNLAEANKEQNRNVQQINNSIQELNKMLQNNTGAIEEISEKTSFLDNTAQKLNELISYFNVQK